MSMSSPERSTGWPEPVSDLGWDEWVAREGEHQTDIEATFDRADEYARLGDFAQALEWLDRASLLSGGLSPQYRRETGAPGSRAGKGQPVMQPSENLSDPRTNAVRHAGVGPDQSVHVELQRWPRRVRVAVADPGGGFTPVKPRFGRGEPSGMGLFLVDQIADRWGVDRAGAGNSVWFEIAYEA